MGSVYKRGNSWCVSARVGGKRVRRVLRGVKTKRDALAQLALIEWSQIADTDDAKAMDRRFAADIRERARRNARPRIIYFIQQEGSGHIKIGIAADPEKRVADLQTGCPTRLRIVATIPNSTTADERALHEHFHEARIRGEWFDGDIITAWLTSQVSAEK